MRSGDARTSGILTNGLTHWRIRRWSHKIRDHVIVCGLQGVGFRIVEQLYLSGTPVIVIDAEADVRFARILEDWGVPHLRRSAYLGDALMDAGLEHATAVINAEVKEIHALETALRIREIRPDVRIVTQMANPSVGRALERVSGKGSVLDVATLGRPVLRRSMPAPRRTRHRAGRRALRSGRGGGGGGQGAHPPDFPGTFREPGARGHHAGRRLRNGPMPGTGPSGRRRGPRCGAGDRRGAQARWHRTQADPTAAAADHLHLPAPGPSVRRLMEEGNKGLTFTVAGLLALIAISTIILRFTYIDPSTHSHMGFLTAAYFTVETVATVGYGDFTFATQDAAMKVFAIALIVIGVALVSIAFALFTNILVSRRIERSLGRRQVPGMVDHIIVIGLGAVGIAVVQGLIAEGQRVVVIERDDNNRFLGQARALGVPVVIADATQSQTHRMVNLDDASAVAVLTSADLTNIETGLAIRESLGDRWEEVPVVLRVFDRDLARMMEQSFGFRHVRSTSALAAPWFVGAALGLDVLSTFYVDQQPFLVGGSRSPPGWAARIGHGRTLGAHPRHRTQSGRQMEANSSIRHGAAHASPGGTRPFCSARTRNSCGSSNAIRC